LAILLAASAAVRLPFWPLHRELEDALRYCIGALVTHVAHPPGSVGYCLLLGWVNHAFHRISFTIILVSFVSAMLAILICHRMAKSIGLGGIPALLATALYAFSINTLKASLMGGPHIVEGLFSILFAWLVWRAIQQHRQMDALLATFVFATAGAFRPTTMPLLIPLWVYMLVHVWGSQRRWPRLAQHLLIAVPIIASWQWANEHFMAINGYGGQTYQTQVLTETAYEFADVNSNTNAVATHLTFHLPGAEFLAWVEIKTGLRLMPHVPGWPTPSLARAARLAMMQTLKQGWWVVLSLPLAILLPILIPLNFSQLARQRKLTFFFALWILPSVASFILGHMGMLTYLQIYLGALCLFVMQLLSGDLHKPHTRFNQRVSHTLCIASLIVSLSAFILTRPFQAPDGVRRTLDLVLLQYDAYSIRNGFGTSRQLSNLNTAGNATGIDAQYINAPTDQALVETAWHNHYPYLPPHR
jgi:hypothetical protein